MCRTARRTVRRAWNGYRIAIPYGEDWDFDLILCREDGRFERVQVKYARSDGCVVVVRPRSDSITNGKVRATKYYTAATIDWVAVWEPSLDRCFYVPASQLGAGMNLLALRLTPCRNHQSGESAWQSGTQPSRRSTPTIARTGP